MGHKHSVYDSDAHFSINPITKVIKNESSKKTTLVQGDHNSERFSFDIPRFIEGHDMMQCNLVEVHYDNKETGTNNISSDFYEVKDMQISPDDEDMVVFSWLIIDTATKYAGSLEFSIKFKCMTGDVCDYKWNTGINTDISVSAGKDNSGVVVERAPNVVDQWRSEIFGDAENAVANINLAEKNALEAVQEEGAAQVAAIQAEGENIINAATIAEQNAKNVLANAIKGNLSGEIVTADDVSPVEHEMIVKVFAKNLIDTNNLVVSGSSAWKATRILFDKPAGTYTLSADFKQNGENTTIQVSAKDYLTGSTFYGSQNSLDANGKVLFTFTIPEDKDKAYIYFYSNYTGNAISAECEFTNIQIEEGTEATEYTPYVDPATVNVRRCGKNLAYSASTGNIKSNGITTIRTENSSEFTIDGTAEATTSVIATKSVLLPPGTYTVSVYGLNTSTSNLDRAYVCDQESEKVLVNYIMTDKPQSFSISEPRYARIEIVFGEGTTYSNRKVRLQIEHGDTATAYEECIEEMKCIPSSDGTVSGMMSTSPNMTILTDTEGVVVECEYIKDTNKVIQKIASALGISI